MKSTPLLLNNLAGLITRNLAPVFGVLLLGWSAPNLLALYFIDTLLAFGAVLLLVMGHVTGLGAGRDRPDSLLQWLHAGAATLFVLPLLAIPLGMPLYFLFMEFGVSLRAMLSDTSFIYGVWAQVLFSVHGTLAAHRGFSQRGDAETVLKRRSQFILARWMAVIFVSMTGFVPLLGPLIGGVVMLLVYAMASIYLDLFPERLEAWLPHGVPSKGATGTPQGTRSQSKSSARVRSEQGKRKKADRTPPKRRP